MPAVEDGLLRVWATSDDAVRVRHILELESLPEELVAEMQPVVLRVFAESVPEGRAVTFAWSRDGLEMLARHFGVGFVASFVAALPELARLNTVLSAEWGSPSADL